MKSKEYTDIDLSEDPRTQVYRQAIDDVREWIGQQQEVPDDRFSVVNDLADLVREAIEGGVGYD